MTKHKDNLSTVTPLVSVIIANYNYGCFLAEAIESVLGQTYQNIELIVVDDGSTDNSRSVIESYGDRLIAIFQANVGQGGAFNAGIACSNGEIICFLDSDDYFYKDKLAKVVAAFLEHPEWVQISHGRTSVDREGAIIGRDPTFFSQGDVQNLLLQWGRYAWAVTSALAYRRSVLQQILPIPTKQSELEVIKDQKTDHLAFAAADTYLTATVPFYGKVGRIRDPLMFYRSHGSNQQARSINLPYLIRQRELTAAYINRAASMVGLNRRFDIQRDSDYRSFKALQQGGTSWTEALQILRLTLLESMAIRHDAKDTLERLLRRGVCALFPGEARTFLRFGPRRYLRFKLTGEQPKNLELLN